MNIKAKQIVQKINDKTIELVKIVYHDLPEDQERIIRENYHSRTKEWDDLGEGLQKIVLISHDYAFRKYTPELLKVYDKIKI